MNEPNISYRSRGEHKADLLERMASASERIASALEAKCADKTWEWSPDGKQLTLFYDTKDKSLDGISKSLDELLDVVEAMMIDVANLSKKEGNDVVADWSKKMDEDMAPLEYDIYDGVKFLKV